MSALRWKISRADGVIAVVRLCQTDHTRRPLFASSGGWRVWYSGVSFNARNRAQIFINGTQVMLGHFSIVGPWHHLQERTELRMSMIEIDAGPHDLNEFSERSPAFRQS
jgi:hypothetical protein